MFRSELVYTLMSPRKPTPAKPKAELREMLAEAVRNTQPKTDTEPLPKTK
jgi:hypothetical protein